MIGMIGRSRSRAVATLLAAALGASGCIPLEPAVSKDGRFAFSNANGHLIVTDPIAPGATRVTARLVTREGYSPTFSPDGRRLAYAGEPTRDEKKAARGAGEARAAIFIADADGSNRKPVLFSQGKILRLRWSPDGRRMAYLAEKKAAAGAGPELFVLRVLDLETGRSEDALEPCGWFFDWAPDGSSIAALKLPLGAPAGLATVKAVAPGADSESRCIATILGHVLSQVVWDPGGASVRVLGLDPELPRVGDIELEGTPRAVVSAPLGGTPTARLLGMDVSFFAPSPDGRFDLEFGGLIYERDSTYRLVVRRRSNGTAVLDRPDVSPWVLPAWLSAREAIFRIPVEEPTFAIANVETGAVRNLVVEVAKPRAPAPVFRNPDGALEVRTAGAGSLLVEGEDVRVEASGGRIRAEVAAGRLRAPDRPEAPEVGFRALALEADGARARLRLSGAEIPLGPFTLRAPAAELEVDLATE